MSVRSLKGIRFPFQFGTLNFPERSEGERVILDSLKSIIFTGRGERVMRPTLGTNIHQYVFGGITKLTKAVVIQATRNAIEEHEPRAEVLSVSAHEGQDGKSIVIDVLYKAAGQIQNESLVLTQTQIAGATAGSS